MSHDKSGAEDVGDPRNAHYVNVNMQSMKGCSGLEVCYGSLIITGTRPAEFEEFTLVVVRLSNTSKIQYE